MNESNATILEINWERAYPITDFIADPVKRAAIEAAIKRHIAKDEMTIVEVKPLYRSFKEKGCNTFFSTSLNEHIYYKNTWNYQPDGGKTNNIVIGYVFAIQQPGTVPLYRLYSSSINNTICTISLSEANNLRQGKQKYAWDNGITGSYILGYVYPSQRSGHAPLYRLFNNSKAQNTLLSSSLSESQWYMNTWGYAWDNGSSHYILGYIIP